ncbi:CBS domain-containing protein [Lysobacter sp. A6]|uniref:CBS domain-containing protein n=1 Tax=Noviluteimonas lactosilytica TaxID=2888523 RepID=A0ABS8JM03_9GAMM|nr:CBS domain-containing protein [Lysobacter lactosilyticus]MCC8364653.1 CBS domain-containing protein [Lysobacter lactosilyticus]
MRIAEICSRDVACIGTTASIRVAALDMRRHHVGCLVAIDCRDAERIPRGIITDRDIAIEVTAMGIDPESVTVADVMARSPATCGENDKLFDAIDTMRVRGVRRLPVVGVRGQLVGIISAGDINEALGMCVRELWQAGSRSRARESEGRQ